MVAAVMQVKLEIDVKAGLQAKVIAVDEAKAMGAYHVILDRSCDLSCFSSFLIDSISLIHAYMDGNLLNMNQVMASHASIPLIWW